MRFLFVVGFLFSTVVNAAGLKFDKDKSPYEFLEDAFFKSKNMRYEDIIDHNEALKTGRFYRSINHISPEVTLEQVLKSTTVFGMTRSTISKTTPNQPGRGPLFPGQSESVSYKKQIAWCNNGLVCQYKEFEQHFPEQDTLTMISPNYVHTFKRYDRKIIIIQVEDRKSRDIYYSYAWLE